MAPSIERFSELAKRQLLPALPNSSLLICEPTSNSAAYVECESNLAIGRLTYWENGTAFCEVLEMATGAEIFAHHYDVGSEMEMLGAFHAFHTQVARNAE